MGQKDFLAGSMLKTTQLALALSAVPFPQQLPIDSTGLQEPLPGVLHNPGPHGLNTDLVSLIQAYPLRFRRHEWLSILHHKKRNKQRKEREGNT